MEWGTKVKFIKGSSVNEGIFVGYESHGGRINEEVSLVLPKGKQFPILKNTNELIKVPDPQPPVENSVDWDEKIWEPFKED